MKKDILSLVLALVAIVIALGGYTYPQAQPQVQTKYGVVEGITNYDSLTLSQDLTVGDDAVISGGALTVTTTNTATSSLIVGCVQQTATSTASPTKLVYTTAGATSTFQGTVYWNFGTCP